MVGRVIDFEVGADLSTTRQNNPQGMLGHGQSNYNNLMVLERGAVVRLC